jgi:hypothetical protein
MRLELLEVLHKMPKNPFLGRAARSWQLSTIASMFSNGCFSRGCCWLIVRMSDLVKKSAQILDNPVSASGPRRGTCPGARPRRVLSPSRAAGRASAILGVAGQLGVPELAW